jgi:hypothetical protein
MGFLLRVGLKGVLLFALVNLIAAAWAEPRLGQFSAYNHLFPGRPRFPFGETPREAYNLSLFDLNAMFASHEISASRSQGEFRVVVIGDSSVWGTLLHPEETLAGQLNQRGLTTADGQRMRFYNLGYPTLSLTKDLLLLDRALAYQPDLVIWLVTLEAFPLETQLSVPLIANNPRAAADLLTRNDLAGADQLALPNFWERTLVGQRKNLADLARLQFYGVLWSATRIDQLYPLDYTRALTDLEADETFHNRTVLSQEELSFDVLEVGQRALGSVPLLVVNEPILISSGANSEIRYNFYYPRWAYDQYRHWLASAASEAGYAYLDAWDLVPADAFTNSAIHIDRQGTARLAEYIQEQLDRFVKK